MLHPAHVAEPPHSGFLLATFQVQKLPSDPSPSLWNALVFSLLLIGDSPGSSKDREIQAVDSIQDSPESASCLHGSLQLLYPALIPTVLEEIVNQATKSNKLTNRRLGIEALAPKH